MLQSRLRENPFRIGWDGLGQFQPLNVPLLFPKVMVISPRIHRLAEGDRVRSLAK